MCEEYQSATDRQVDIVFKTLKCYPAVLTKDHPESVNTEAVGEGGLCDFRKRSCKKISRGENSFTDSEARKNPTEKYRSLRHCIELVCSLGYISVRCNWK